MIKDVDTGALRAFDFNNLLKRIPELRLLDCEIDTISFEPPIDSSTKLTKPTELTEPTTPTKSSTKPSNPVFFSIQRAISSALAASWLALVRIFQSVPCGP